MSESIPTTRRKGKPLFVSLFTVVAFSSFRLWNSIGRATLFTDTIEGHESKPPEFREVFPDASVVEKLENFTDLSALVSLHNLPVPHNLNILFMGDSLTRYQYLDLVYFLSHNGTWPSPDDSPNMVVENTHKNGWVQFFNFTSSALRPYEQCDCFRLQAALKAVENRYYYDPQRNNTVTYLQKFGANPFRTSWNVTDVHQQHELVQLPGDRTFAHTDAVNWVDTIRNFVCQMSPKPSVFIFNAGIWTDHDLVNVDMQQNIVAALKECDIVSMYKTTTKMSDLRNRTWDEYERQLCNLTDYCVDLSWTAMVPDEHYWDTKHFREPIYSMMNVQLLSLLASHGYLAPSESVS